MRLWLILIGTLIVQEIVSTNVALIAARHAGYSSLLIHLAFFIATMLDFAVGYAVGKWVQRRFKGSRLVTRAEESTRRFERYMGRYGERLTLMLIGFVSYAYVNSFLASWLELSTGEIFLWLFLGDLGWYALAWLLVLGAKSASANFSIELYVLVGVSILFIIGIRYLARSIFKDR